MNFFRIYVCIDIIVEFPKSLARNVAWSPVRVRTAWNVCVRLQERDSAGRSCRQVGTDSRVRAMYTRVRIYTRETGGVPIYNGDIIADYLRFRVDNRKFS